MARAFLIRREPSFLYGQVHALLEGEKVSLTLIERDGVWILHGWLNDPEYTGGYEPFSQMTRRELERTYDGLSDERWWFISLNDGSPVGFISNRLHDGYQVIQFFLAPEERGKGYATEAARIIVDYLFLSHDIVRVQAETHPENTAHQRALESNGFTREALIRKSLFSRGAWRDSVLYSILREEWKGPHYNW